MVFSDFDLAWEKKPPGWYHPRGCKSSGNQGSERVFIFQIVEFVILVEKNILKGFVTFDHEPIVKQFIIVFLILKDFVIIITEVNYLRCVVQISKIGIFLILKPAEITIFLIIELIFLITVFRHAVLLASKNKCPTTYNSK